MKKKICFVTGSRAEFDLIRKLLILFEKSKHFELHVLVTGEHLSKVHGESYKYVKKFSFKNTIYIKNLNNNRNKNEIMNSINAGNKKINLVLKKIKPDLVAIAGDRYEIISAALCSFFLQIPIIHFFGGEVTSGSLDDTIRHILSKISNFHFVTHSNHFKRLLQLGEEKKNIFQINHIGFDSLLENKFIEKNKLFKLLKIKNLEKNILVVFHPENNSSKNIKLQAVNICNSLSNFKEHNLIFNAPNSDINSDIIAKVFLNFVKKNKNAYYIRNLGHQKYLSLLRIVDFIIGNSSSGLSEMPYFLKPTINLGNRQLGRPISKSIINSNFNQRNIKQAIKKAKNLNFLNSIKKQKTYYNYQTGGSKKVFDKIFKLTNQIDLKKPIIKKFQDLKF